MKLTQPQILTSSASGCRVSVIIPTCESAGHIGRCLQSLNEQTRHVDEIIVVDAFSRDGTRRIASQLGAKIVLAHGTQAAARNAGLANSNGDYVLFLDSDQKLEGNVVEDSVSRCVRDGADAVKIPELFVGINYWGRCSALWKNSMVKAWGPGGGIPRFYTRRLLLQSSGYNGSLRFWEDLELHDRIRPSSGWRQAWCRGHVIHYESASLRDVVSKYISYGRSIATFRSSSSNRPYRSTLKLTLHTLLHLLRNPGQSPLIFFGCLVQVFLKGACAALGFLAEPRRREN